MLIMETDDKGKDRIRTKCTLADLQLDDCHHIEPDSQKVPLIVKYCLGNYKDCEIYKKVRGQKCK